MKTSRIVLLILPILFTAQACNLLTGGGQQGSGSLGIFLSTDSGDSWHEGKGRGQLNLVSASIYKLFVQEGEPRNIIAASANSGIIASDDFGETWVTLLPDFVGYDVFINPADEEEIFASGAKGRLAAIYRSPDRGRTWIQVYNEPAGEGAASVLALDPNNSKIMYAGLTTGSLLQSSDGGDTWHKLTNFKDRIVDIGVGDGVIYTLNTKTGLNRSTDDGQTWTAFKTEKTDKVFNVLFMDPLDDSVVYVGSDGGLSRSMDQGETWSRLPVPASAKVANVTAIQISESSRGEIYAGVRSTIYRSDDNGTTWHTVQLSTHRVVSDIAVDPDESNRIYTGLKP